MKKIVYSVALVATTLFTLNSCERYLDITPTGVVIPTTEEDFRALLVRGYSVYPDYKARIAFRSDEIFLNTGREDASKYKDIYTWNDTTPDPTTNPYHYSEFYTSIFYTNYVIENATSKLTDGATKKQILGEAYALRALNYFGLVNLYSDVFTGNNGNAESVPIITTPNIEGDFPKSTLNEVYNQIFSDIAQAEALLNQSKFDAGLNYRFTTTALNAFKARIYQYRGEWEKVVQEVDKVLAVNNNLEDFNNFSVLPVSYKSVESVMNLDFNVNRDLQQLGFASDELIALYDQTNDLRFEKYFEPSGAKFRTKKYNSANELKSTFRVGELMLIKAEALAKLGRESESKNVLLALAEKRYNATGLANFTAQINGLSGNAYLAELLNERFRETNYEGLRWFDLRRTGKPALQHSLDGTIHNLNQGDVRYTLPYPKEARLRNPLLN